MSLGRFAHARVGLGAAILLPAMLALSVVLVHAPTFDGSFLNYDDPWLIEHNPVYRMDFATALGKIWFDLSDATRMALGAEYLPMRDMSHLVEAKTVGIAARPMRIVQLGLYVVACLFMRSFLHALFSRGQKGQGAQTLATAEIAAWFFALHPAHVESVDWLAGRKDVLALLFVSAALWIYVRHKGRWGWLTLPLLAAAVLSKSVALATFVMLPLFDLFVGRKVRWPLVASAAALSLTALIVHSGVGATVQMVATPVGGSRLHAAATMGPIMLRYLSHSFLPFGMSVSYDVDVRSPDDISAWLGYLPLLVAGGMALWAWRRHGNRVWFVAWAIFVICMGPTSQILVPLQNIEADRYLLFAILGPALIVGTLAAPLVQSQSQLGRLRTPLSPILLALIFAPMLWATANRSATFSNSISLWQDAFGKTQTRAVTAYQLGKAFESAGQYREAANAFGTALQRDPTGPIGGKALSNLSRILISKGRHADAESLLRKGVLVFKDNPRVANNLAALFERTGRAAQALPLYLDLVKRFPDYTNAQRALHRLRAQGL